jgi:hypothetical protein
MRAGPAAFAAQRRERHPLAVRHKAAGEGSRTVERARQAALHDTFHYVCRHVRLRQTDDTAEECPAVIVPEIAAALEFGIGAPQLVGKPAARGWPGFGKAPTESTTAAARGLDLEGAR